MAKHVRIQKTKVVQSHKDASLGEYSPYWTDAANRLTDSAGFTEHPQGNPDILPETKISAPSTPQLIMGEAIEHLQGRQKEVYMLLMRDSKTYAEAAEILGITRGAVQTYEKRAISFIEAWCKNAIGKGRV
jgi:RNA polymerase sigma factor (sigma-70 family)